MADFRLGLIVSDSSISDGDRVWTTKRKVYLHQGALLAFAGNVSERVTFLLWLKSGQEGKPPAFTNSEALVMNEHGLFHYDFTKVLQPVESGIEAIGSGAMAAMAAYEAMGFDDPVRAVKIVCKHDARSRAPVRTYRLKR